MNVNVTLLYVTINQSLQDFCGTFFRFLRPKLTDFAAAFLKIISNFVAIFAAFLVLFCRENIPQTTFFILFLPHEPSGSVIYKKKTLIIT